MSKKRKKIPIQWSSPPSSPFFRERMNPETLEDVPEQLDKTEEAKDTPSGKLEGNEELKSEESHQNSQSKSGELIPSSLPEELLPTREELQVIQKELFEKDELVFSWEETEKKSKEKEMPKQNKSPKKKKKTRNAKDTKQMDVFEFSSQTEVTRRHQRNLERHWILSQSSQSQSSCDDQKENLKSSKESQTEAENGKCIVGENDLNDSTFSLNLALSGSNSQVEITSSLQEIDKEVVKNTKQSLNQIQEFLVSHQRNIANKKIDSEPWDYQLSQTEYLKELENEFENK